MQRAVHSGFFTLIYGRAKQSNIFRCVIISIDSIYFTVCISAFKHFVCSFTNMFTFITRLTCISRINGNNFYSIKRSFIFNLFTKVGEIPFTKFGFKLFIPSFRSKSNVCQIFKRNAFVLFFSRLDNRFCNSMINNTGSCSFFTRKPFQKFFTTFSAFALNRTTNFLPMFTLKG